MYILYLASGLLMLYFGADWLVMSASSIANRFHLPPLLIGLTVVAFGTSTPELLVSLHTAITGMSAVSVGNVVGSNMFNIAVILGISAIIYPLKTDIKLIRIDVPVMILSSGLFYLFFLDNYLSRFEGICLFGLLIIYIVFSYRMGARDHSGSNYTEPIPALNHVFVELLVIIAGLVALAIGANLFVKGAVKLATLLGWSQTIIGITIVAAGTSLPELATSIVAAVHKKADIAIGNVVGSNIFNILAVLGLSASIHPMRVADFPHYDIWVMLFISLLLLPFVRTRFQLQRWEGVVLLSGYLLYLVFIL